MCFYPGPPGSIDTNLVGGQRLRLSGQDYFYDWSQNHVGKFLFWTRIFNLRLRWVGFNHGSYLVYWPPKEVKSRKLWIFEVLECLRKSLLSLIRMWPLKMNYWEIPTWIHTHSSFRTVENVHFKSKFPWIGSFKIVKCHGSVLFQPFYKEGLRVSKFTHLPRWMHPCWFIWDEILKPLKTMLDQFCSNPLTKKVCGCYP